jgi:hemolysin III
MPKKYRPAPIRPERQGGAPPVTLSGVSQVTGRPQSLGEEIANSVSHGVGFLAAAAATPFLILAAARNGSAADIVGAAVFAATIALLYLASTLYHALPRPQVKRVFRIMDHNAIYLLIAGTYTPFTLGVLEGAWGWSLFGVIWGLAALGIAGNAIGGMRFPKLTTGVYIAMGWLVVVAAKPLWDRMPPAGLAWLALGGLAYTGGVAFYALSRRVRYTHFAWHLCVLTGTACHFVAVYRYAL